MSLKDELDKLRAASAEKFPRETLAVMQGATKDLIATGIAEQSANQGSAAPDFSLPNAHGEPVASDGSRCGGTAPPWSPSTGLPGGWCPSIATSSSRRCKTGCRRSRRSARARLVAITPDTRRTTRFGTLHAGEERDRLRPC